MAKRQPTAIISNGHEYKGINPWDLDDSSEAWMPLAGKIPGDLRKLVPVLFGAWGVRCKALADLPFTIYRGDKEIDNSDNYKNALGFLDDPYRFLWLAEASLCGNGEAYYFRMYNNVKTVELHYMNPDTIEMLDVKDWKPTGFKRTYGKGQSKELKHDEVLYMWLPDESVEVGPPTVWPVRSALSVAGSIAAVNQFIESHSARGMTKMFLLAMKGNPPVQEKQRIEHWWNGIMRQKNQAKWNIFNADELTPTIVGEGLQQLESGKVIDNLQGQVLSAMGVPPSLLLANAANYATADQDSRNLYTNTIVPDARIIQAAMNKQIMGEYRIEFQPDRLEVFQRDESVRANSLSMLTSAMSTGDPLAVLISLDVLGYDLSDEAKKYLAELITSRKKQTEQAAVELSRSDREENQDEQRAGEDAEDMAKFMRKALKKIGSDVRFVSDNVPADKLRIIHAGLSECKSEADVRALFELADTETAPGLIELADAIREAARAIVTDEKKGEECAPTS